MNNKDEYVKLIRERLSDYRFYHSMCVAQSAVELARRYGADEQKAYVAGILHDVMKETEPSQQLEVIKKAGMSITPLEKSNKKFYHQISGSAFVRSELGIDDEDIVNSIRFHTTGRANMSLMEQIIYLADFISADRDYDDVETMRQRTQISKEDGMLYAMQYTIVSVIKKGNVLHPETVNAYNWLIGNKLKNEE